MLKKKTFYFCLFYFLLLLTHVSTRTCVRTYVLTFTFFFKIYPYFDVTYLRHLHGTMSHTILKQLEKKKRPWRVHAPSVGGIAPESKRDSFSRPGDTHELLPKRKVTHRGGHPTPQPHSGLHCVLEAVTTSSELFETTSTRSFHGVRAKAAQTARSRSNLTVQLS